MKNPHLGTNFDDFLKEEDNLAEVKAVAVKRGIAFKIKQMMQQNNLSKTALAKKMCTSHSTLDTGSIYSDQPPKKIHRVIKKYGHPLSYMI